uniref:Uncharacterized protein n=1 Tax=viral metagenome TaxID=1070528 RepID=A0A6M3JHB2_9ZZZZ
MIFFRQYRLTKALSALAIERGREAMLASLPKDNSYYIDQWVASHCRVIELRGKIEYLSAGLGQVGQNGNG